MALIDLLFLCNLKCKCMQYTIVVLWCDQCMFLLTEQNYIDRGKIPSVMMPFAFWELNAYYYNYIFTTLLVFTKEIARHDAEYKLFIDWLQTV
jgi:hypothetical protein